MLYCRKLHLEPPKPSRLVFPAADPNPMNHRRRKDLNPEPYRRCFRLAAYRADLGPFCLRLDESFLRKQGRSFQHFEFRRLP